MPSLFDLEHKRLRKEIQERKAKLVLIQLPEGLKQYGPMLATTVAKAGAIPILSADSCYGACDLATAEAKRLGADLLVHYGHTEMSTHPSISVLHIEAKAKGSIKNVTKKALPHLETWREIGLVTTIQHVHMLDEARDVLLNVGKTVKIGDAGQLDYAGQVTGCNYSNAKVVSMEVEAFLFIGGGKFHALGVALATTKPTVVSDPYEKRAFIIEDETAAMLKRRWARIHETKQAKKIGILIGLKTGQKRLDQALKMKKLSENAGKQVTLFALKEITPEALMQFPAVEAFINTACPRLSLDDAKNFRRPLLTPNEMLVVLGELKWGELCAKGWFES